MIILNGLQCRTVYWLMDQTVFIKRMTGLRVPTNHVFLYKAKKMERGLLLERGLFFHKTLFQHPSCSYIWFVAQIHVFSCCAVEYFFFLWHSWSRHPDWKTHYCNSLFLCLSKPSLDRLQTVQHPTRLLTRSSKRCHVTLILSSFGITFRALLGQIPLYIKINLCIHM